ncbi:MAG: hypothetical protein AAFO94_03590, partial [Bacteroidota bacterium]
MRKFITIYLHVGFFTCIVFVLGAQTASVKVADAHLQLDENSVLKISGNFSDAGTATIDNDGLISVEGAFIHNSATEGFINRNVLGRLRLYNYDKSTFIGGQHDLYLENLIVDNPYNIASTTDLYIEHALHLLNGKLFTGAHLVYMRNTSNNAILGYNERRYIAGTLRRAVRIGTTYHFPIGSYDYYEPATIDLQNIGTATYVEMSFEQKSEANAAVELEGQPLTEFLDYGYWRLSNTDPGNTWFDLTLTSNGHDNGGTTESKYALFRRRSADWEATGTHEAVVPNGTQRGPLSARRTGVTGLGDFIIGKFDETVRVDQLAESGFRFIAAVQSAQQLQVRFESFSSDAFDLRLYNLSGQ